jgi:hypothetical protein
MAKINIIDKIDMFLSDETTTGAVAVNTSGVGYPVKRKKKKKNEYKVTEGYIFVVHKKKNKEMRIPDDPKVIKKYREKGYEIKESIFGATLTSTQIAGSGQTRAVGDYSQDVLNLKKPVRFSKLTGNFIPLEELQEAISHKHSNKEMKQYYANVSKYVNRGSTFDAASERAKDELRKGMYKKIKKKR